MISWGLKVNDYGNAIQDEDGCFIKVEGQGVTEDIWAEMTAYAENNGLKGGNYKKLNRPFENKLLGLPREVRERMAGRVEDFTYKMLVNVFNAQGSADIAIGEILAAGSYDPGPNTQRVENPDEWTPEKIAARAKTINSDKGSTGDFDD